MVKRRKLNLLFNAHCYEDQVEIVQFRPGNARDAKSLTMIGVYSLSCGLSYGFDSRD
jgi:hypothetical protein